MAGVDCQVDGQQARSTLREYYHIFHLFLGEKVALRQFALHKRQHCITSPYGERSHFGENQEQFQQFAFLFHRPVSFSREEITPLSCSPREVL